MAACAVLVVGQRSENSTQFYQAEKKPSLVLFGCGGARGAHAKCGRTASLGGNGGGFKVPILKN